MFVLYLHTVIPCIYISYIPIAISTGETFFICLHSSLLIHIHMFKTKYNMHIFYKDTCNEINNIFKKQRAYLRILTQYIHSNDKAYVNVSHTICATLCGIDVLVTSVPCEFSLNKITKKLFAPPANMQELLSHTQAKFHKIIRFNSVSPAKVLNPGSLPDLPVISSMTSLVGKFLHWGQIPLNFTYSCLSSNFLRLTGAQLGHPNNQTALHARAERSRLVYPL